MPKNRRTISSQNQLSRLGDLSSSVRGISDLGVINQNRGGDITWLFFESREQEIIP